jgi:hypothetical protein
MSRFHLKPDVAPSMGSVAFAGAPCAADLAIDLAEYGKTREQAHIPASDIGGIRRNGPICLAELVLPIDKYAIATLTLHGIDAA